MPELILQLEQRGRVLGEWTLTNAPISMNLRDPLTGNIVATLRAELPVPAQAAPAPQPNETFDAPTEQSADMGELDLDPPEIAPNTDHYDEVGVIGLSSQGEPERIPGDDFTMPLPEPTDPEVAPQRELARIGPGYGAEKTRTATGAVERTLEPIQGRSLNEEKTNIRPDSRSERTPTVPEDYGTTRRPDAAFPPISEDRDPMLEVWFYKNGQWVRRGWLSNGQRASLRGGVIRCTRGGDLLVSPGNWFTISAVLPNGKQVQVEPGSKPVRMPAGTAVTLWDGERGLHVREMENADDTVRSTSNHSYTGAAYTSGAPG